VKVISFSGDIMNFTEIIRNAVTENESYRKLDHTKGFHVGFGINAAFARPMGIAITSLILNNPHTSFTFHIFACSIEDIDRSRLNELSLRHSNINIIIYDVNEKAINMLPTKRSYPLATYFRIMMPIVLSELTCILYLDGDIICLRDINDLVNLDIDKYLAAVVLDVKSVGNMKVKELNMKYGNYFNAGIMMINIKQWNAENISERAMNILAEHGGRYSLLDQDVLNLLLEQKIKLLPDRFNHIYGKIEQKKIPADTVILHCANVPKPWKVFCRTGAQDYYLEYENLSPWKGIPLEPPIRYKDAKYYSQKLAGQRHFAKALYWFLQYVKMKYMKCGAD
jgi:lipopolysaccharide biosynthesis glycosyltransferase